MTEKNRITLALEDAESSGRKVLRFDACDPLAEGYLFPKEILEKEFSRFLNLKIYQPDPRGLLSARQALSLWYKQRSIHIAPDNFFLTSSTSEAYAHLFRLLCQNQGELLLPSPAYPLFDELASQSSAKTCTYRLNEKKDWAIDLEYLEASLSNQTRAVVLVSPHNPTGSCITKDECRQLAAICTRHNLALICDEVFSEFYWKEDSLARPAGFDEFPIVFTLNGLSKMAALPWAKLGWIAVSGHDKKQIESVCRKLEFIMDAWLASSTWIQQALPAILTEGRIFMQQMAEGISESRSLILQRLSKRNDISFTEPAGSYYLTVKTQHQDEEEQCLKWIKEKNLYLPPGYFFDIEGSAHFVLSFLPKKEKINRLLDAWLS